MRALDGGIAPSAFPLYARRKAAETSDACEPILVKRYGGNRLYDTTKARYVTVDELRGLA